MLFIKIDLTYVMALPSGLNHLIFLFDPEFEFDARELHSSWMSLPSLPVRAYLLTESDVLDSEYERFFRTRSFFEGL